MKEIKIVESNEINRMEKDVNSLLNDGWKLYGEMKVRDESDNDNYYIYWIVMVK